MSVHTMSIPPYALTRLRELTMSRLTLRMLTHQTFGALFCVYWLMRLELDEVDGSQGLGGQSGFCFGVDEDTWEITTFKDSSFNKKQSPVGAVAPTEKSKKCAFLLSHNWSQLHALMIDAGLLTRTEGGGAAVCVERTRAMLALTAIHDVTDRH